MLRDTVSFTDIAERVCNTMENKFNDGNTYHLHEKMFFEFPDDIAEDLKNYEKKICRNKKTHEDTCLLNLDMADALPLVCLLCSWVISVLLVQLRT